MEAKGKAAVGFTGRVQGVDGRVADGDDRHAVGPHLHGHPHHRPRRHGQQEREALAARQEDGMEGTPATNSRR